MNANRCGEHVGGDGDNFKCVIVLSINADDDVVDVIKICIYFVVLDHQGWVIL